MCGDRWGLDVFLLLNSARVFQNGVSCFFSDAISIYYSRPSIVIGMVIGPNAQVRVLLLAALTTDSLSLPLGLSLTPEAPACGRTLET
ncbi:hypothetical protein PG999_000175 [Apiospora kogelbergensis]|uniref:Uncharacterized protein n=1 Tax=Apiospora kogelbergensis TaxID=1337665 RepID=A0AAW0RAQ4_9PEZI